MMTDSLTSSQNEINFEQLISSIESVHSELSAQASRAVNVSLTLRNWLIGCYIGEYELKGSDRAEYGKEIYQRLAKELDQTAVSRCTARELRRYRQFYAYYPQMWESLTPTLQKALNAMAIENRESLTPISGNQLVSTLSFTHIAELLHIKDASKRAFYEIECIQGHWSVRELKRQINSLYYERSGLSFDKEKLSELAQHTAEQAQP